MDLHQIDQPIVKAAKRITCFNLLVKPLMTIAVALLLKFYLNKKRDLFCLLTIARERSTISVGCWRRSFSLVVEIFSRLGGSLVTKLSTPTSR